LSDDFREGWRKLQNEKLHNLFSSPNIIRMKLRKVRLVRHVASMRRLGDVYNILVGKLEGNGPLERPKHR
jgi:hypothetical protein